MRAHKLTHTHSERERGVFIRTQIKTGSQNDDNKKESERAREI